jgi:hypothetical protein
MTMAENKQDTKPDTIPSGTRASRIVPLGLLCALGLAIVVNQVRGKTNQTLDGVVVMDFSHYKFYPGLKDCRLKGTPYWLVPDRRFHDRAPMPSTSDFEHLERLFHAAWRVKLRGNLSAIGRYGPQGEHWRELDVLYVIDAVQLDCKDENIRTSP